jgi:di/tricarboxylate transporter
LNQLLTSGTSQARLILPVFMLNGLGAQYSSMLLAVFYVYSGYSLNNGLIVSGSVNDSNSSSVTASSSMKFSTYLSLSLR